MPLKDVNAGWPPFEALPALMKQWPKPCLGFYDYWKSLRQSELLPTTERCLDTLPPLFVPSTYIIEVVGTHLCMRFQGEDLIYGWGHDFTIEPLAKHQPADTLESLSALMNAIVTHPCGYGSHSHYVTSRGRPAEAYFVGFPLAVAAGRPARVVGYTHEQIFLENGERTWDTFSILKHGWIDIGAGTP